MREKLEKDDAALLNFSMRFLKQVLFGEMTISLKEGAAEQRIDERKGEWEKRRAAEIEKNSECDERYELPDKGRLKTKEKGPDWVRECEDTALACRSANGLMQRVLGSFVSRHRRA